MELSREQKELLEESIMVLNIPVRLANRLYDEGVHTVRDLLHCCPKQSCKCGLRHLWLMPDVAGRSLQQIWEALEEHGFYRKNRHAARDQNHKSH